MSPMYDMIWKGVVFSLKMQRSDGVDGVRNYSREAVCNGELQRGLLEKLRLHYLTGIELKDGKGIRIVQLFNCLSNAWIVTTWKSGHSSC